MLTATFPYNPVLAGMRYQGDQLTLVFKKKNGTQERTYSEVPAPIAYGLFYRKTASEVLSYFARFIKQKYKVVKVR